MAGGPERRAAGATIKVARAAAKRATLHSYRAPYTPGRIARLLRAPSLPDAVGGRVVLVTGASSGIGRATAVRLAGAGATVLLVSRTAAALEEVREEIARTGAIAQAHACDLSDSAAVDALVRDVLEQYGHVDVLVNNAGHSIRRSIADSVDRPEDYERTMRLNFHGAVRLTLGLLPAMQERGFGHVITVNTLGLAVATPRFSAYLASKAALEAFTRCLAAECRGAGIHATTVHMPLVRTPMIAPTRSYDRAPAISADEAAGMIAEAVRTRPARVSPRAAASFELAWTAAPEALERTMQAAYELTGPRSEQDGRTRDPGLARSVVGGIGRALRVRL
jgi:NAD(P)-dependent dehydrogenase (short-subunit alcohol dehydrogenase family)